MSRTAFQPVMIALIAILFMVKSFVPLGFMPNIGGNNDVSAITICSGADQVQIFVDGDGNKVPAPSQHSPSQICEFSIASVFTSFDVPQAVITPITISVPLSYEHEVAPSITIAQNFNARAPPFLQA